MLDAMIAVQPLVVARYLATGIPPLRVGNRHPLSAPFGVYRAADEPFVLAVLNEKLFAALATLIGRPEIAADPRFATDSDRSANEPALKAVIESWSAGLTASEAVAMLTRGGIPAACIQSIAQALSSDQVAGRDLLQTITHPMLGAMRVPLQPVHFGGLSRGGTAPAPRLDEHGAAIRNELGA
jgi:CoA:oxalate CoA-transferase